MTTPFTAEDYAVWQDNPVTRFVMAGVARLAEAQKGAWTEAAWGGNLDPLLRERCVTRADAYEGLANLTYEQALEANGMELPSELDRTNAG